MDTVEAIIIFGYSKDGMNLWDRGSVEIPIDTPRHQCKQKAEEEFVEWWGNRRTPETPVIYFVLYEGLSNDSSDKYYAFHSIKKDLPENS